MNEDQLPKRQLRWHLELVQGKRRRTKVKWLDVVEQVAATKGVGRDLEEAETLRRLLHTNMMAKHAHTIEVLGIMLQLTAGNE
jgi:hypothetical protein